MRTIKFFPKTIIALLSLASIFIPGVSGRQEPTGANLYSARLIEEMKQLQRAALSSDFAYKQAAFLCNNIGPRLSGSPQAAAAVEYVAGVMRRMGLDVQLERVMVPHWVRGVETGELVQYPGQPAQTTQKIVLTALGGSVATQPSGLTAEVVVVDDYEQLAALGRERTEGKIVLFNARFDMRMAEQGNAFDAYGQAVAYRYGGPGAAARAGAVASLVRSAGGASYRLAHTGSMAYADDAPKIPAAAVTHEDADLIAHLATQGTVRIRLTLTPQTLPEVASYNVIADLKGTEHPEQVVIVSGHLDSWDLGTGALDDAAGVAVAMQAAQLIKQLNLRPRRTIRVIAWMNEENGLAGARVYAQNRAKEIANHVAAIECDTGAGHPVGFYANVNPKALALLGPISAVLARSGAGAIRHSLDPVGADISPLTTAGVPGFSPYQDVRTYFDYHHTTADTLDKIVPGELAENAAVMVVLAYGLANMEEPLPR